MMSAMTALEVLSDAESSCPWQPARAAIPAGPFLVAGLGRAGQGAVLALRRAVGSHLVRAWDESTSAGMQRVRRELEAAGVRTILGRRLTRREVGWARTIVKSPGIPFSVPVIQRALGKKREVFDELELGWRLSRAPILAVTGTNGKSTVCGLASSVLAAGGHRVRLAGNTQFGPPLSALASESCDWIVCEVSSFQLEGCVHMLPEIAVFTNLTHEHLGRHGTLQHYGELKRRLFINEGVPVPQAIVDVDSSFGRDLAVDIECRGSEVTRVGFSAQADYRVLGADWTLRRAEATLATPTGRISLLTNLPGRYNARNVAAALAIADLMGVERRRSVATLNGYVGPPGRFEHVDAGKGFDLIVDFAHSPDAIEQLLLTVRAGMRPGGRLMVVFGLGGPSGTATHEMGRLAAQLSDRLILTTSGFRGSPRMPCLASILAGARTAEGGTVEIILDRRVAIERAVAAASPDDAIVIPGRGALSYMQSDRRGEPTTFDDRDVAREILCAAMARQTQRTMEPLAPSPPSR